MKFIKKTNNAEQVGFNNNKTEGEIYFNRNNFPSDTKGGLKGAVYYVQNCIIPAHKNIADDIQPRIIENRDLLVLFSPEENNLDVVYLNVKDANDRVILTRTLVNDDSRIPLCQQINLVDNPVFLHSDDFDITIADDYTLRKISSDVELFETTISEHFRIKIRTSNGNYAESFTLRNNPAFSGRAIFFVCDSGYPVEIIRPYGNRIKMIRGESYLFVNHHGNWVTEQDVQFSLIRYIKNCWHTLILAEAIHSGIKFEFFTDTKVGVIDNVDIGAPNKLLLHTISIGMLTPYLKKFEFQSHPEYHRQYFQQIPISQLIVSTYDPIYLEEIMMPDGEFILDFARDEGGVHNGSMREFIAKDLISQGINYANYGYTCSKLQDANRTMAVGQICVHVSVGEYVNNTVTHGQSGGAGLATLLNTIGNEFSHELGHNYGLGHYPGGFYGSVNQVPSVRNSTWGWDKDNHFFIPNFEKEISKRATFLTEKPNETQYADPFEGHSLGRDAMASGSPLYPEANAFTLHTPYVLSTIQKFFESKAMFNHASPTGFSIWEPQSQKMVPYKLLNDSVDFVTFTVTNNVDITANDLNVYLKNGSNVLIRTRDGRYAKFVYLPDADSSNNGLIVRFEVNSTYSVSVEVNGTTEMLHTGAKMSFISNGKYWELLDSEAMLANVVPYKQGVKVITLVGYYDPEEKLVSYIYPALNGSYGHVYRYSRKSSCYLQVEYASGEKQTYPLETFRYIANKMNKFHINVERNLQPRKISLYINDKFVIQKSINLGSDNLSYTVNGAPSLQ